MQTVCKLAKATRQSVDDVPGRLHRGLRERDRNEKQEFRVIYHLAVIMSSGFNDTLTNLARPKTSATITVRVVKSFEFRTERSLVLRDINLETTTVGGLKEIVRTGGFVYAPPSRFLNRPPVSIAIQTQPGWKPYRSAHFGLPIPLCHSCKGIDADPSFTPFL